MEGLVWEHLHLSLFTTYISKLALGLEKKLASLGDAVPLPVPKEQALPVGAACWGSEGAVLASQHPFDDLSSSVSQGQLTACQGQLRNDILRALRGLVTREKHVGG